jgi:hypothetical protein
MYHTAINGFGVTEHVRVGSSVMVNVSNPVLWVKMDKSCFDTSIKMEESFWEN